MKPILEQLESRLCLTAVIDHNGPVLSSPQLAALYVGVAPQNDFMAILAGPYAQKATPYGVGAGAFVGSASVPNPGPISDSGVQALLALEIQSGKLPAPGPNSAYLVLLPANVTDPNQANGSGYHSYFMLGGHPVVYGVNYPQSFPGLGGESIPEAHEFIEMVTDPLLNAWYGAGGLTQEPADLFNWVPAVVAGYTVSQFALPDGSPAIAPPKPTTATTPAQVASVAGNLFALAVNRIEADLFGLLSLFNPAFQSQQMLAQTEVSANPWSNTATGRQVEQQADAVFIAWLGDLPS
jgi:hypothetical protein